MYIYILHIKYYVLYILGGKAVFFFSGILVVLCGLLGPLQTTNCPASHTKPLGVVRGYVVKN